MVGGSLQQLVIGELLCLSSCNKARSGTWASGGAPARHVKVRGTAVYIRFGKDESISKSHEVAGLANEAAGPGEYIQNPKESLKRGFGLGENCCRRREERGEEGTKDIHGHGTR